MCVVFVDGDQSHDAAIPDHCRNSIGGYRPRVALAFKASLWPLTGRHQDRAGRFQFLFSVDNECACFVGDYGFDLDIQALIIATGFTHLILAGSSQFPGSGFTWKESHGWAQHPSGDIRQP